MQALAVCNQPLSAPCATTALVNAPPVPAHVGRAALEAIGSVAWVCGVPQDRSLLPTQSALAQVVKSGLSATPVDRFESDRPPALPPRVSAGPCIDLSAGGIDRSVKPPVSFEYDRLDFSLDPTFLMSGGVQAYSKLVKKSDLSPELLAAVETLDREGIFEGSGEHISLLKVAFLIPGKTAADFDEKLLRSDQYLRATTERTRLEAPEAPGNLRVCRELPLFGEVHTEFEVTTDTRPPTDASLLEVCKAVDPDLGPSDRWVYTKLMFSSHKALQRSQYLAQFYDLPDKSGVLFVNYVLADLAMQNASRTERLTFWALPDSLRRSSVRAELEKLAGGARNVRRAE